MYIQTLLKGPLSIYQTGATQDTGVANNYALLIFMHLPQTELMKNNIR